MKTGSEIIEVITRRRRILFAGFVARMEDTKRSRRVLLGKLIEGACCVRVQKKELRVAMPTSGQLQPRTRRNGARRRNKRVECFIAEYLAAEKVRDVLRHVVVCQNVTVSAKERIVQSKQCSCSSARNS